MKLTAAALISSLALLAACSSAPKKTVQSPANGAARTLIFPYGSYQHLVHVSLKNANGKGPGEMDFQGAFSFAPDRISLIALSGFGTTVFRVEEDVKSGDVSVKTFVPALEKFEPKIREYYAILRDVLTAPRESGGQGGKSRVLAKTPQGLPSEIELSGGKGPVRARLESFDENDIPKTVLISHPDFEVDVKVQGYEI